MRTLAGFLLGFAMMAVIGGFIAKTDRARALDEGQHKVSEQWFELMKKEAHNCKHGELLTVCDVDRVPGECASVAVDCAETVGGKSFQTPEETGMTKKGDEVKK